MIDMVAQSCPSLKKFGMKCNPIATKKNYRSMMFSRLENLSKLDGIAFTDKDKERVEDEDKILSMHLIMESSIEQRKGFEQDTANLEESENSSNHLSKRQVEWESQIETLYLSHKQIGVISNLEMFINLRKLNLMDNNITKMQNLE
jgi:Leucine-rich repeat (LRR) protein